MRVAALTVALLTLTTTAFAHVRVTPRESKPGAKETYTLRVPTDGKVTRRSVTLEVAEGSAFSPHPLLRVASRRFSVRAIAP